MRIYKAADYKEMSRKAANVIAAQVTMKPDCVLGLATGLASGALTCQLAGLTLSLNLVFFFFFF